jgi:serine/threonine-protein kinase
MANGSDNRARGQTSSDPRAVSSGVFPALSSTGLHAASSGALPALSSTGLHAISATLQALPTPTPDPTYSAFASLGRYQILARLATGGMAEVYLARHGELTGFKTLVVVKKVLPHLAQNPSFIAMFLDEARIASLLDHPNIVRIHEVGRVDDEYFLAMELVQGKPLWTLIRHSEQMKETLDHKLAALVASQAAAGLQHAHELKDQAGTPLGLVHRDISPQNILISFEGSVKLIDFGVARAMGRLNETATGKMKGKVAYMAPEQTRGEDVDARADLFSLGVVLWEMVTGRRLFRRDNEFATMRAVLDDAIDPPSRIAAVPSDLDYIVMRALSRDRARRYQTAEEMRIDLDHFVFKSGGASTRDLATTMKKWFAVDYTQWQTAARVALDMRESDPPIEIMFPDLMSGRGTGSRSLPQLKITGSSVRSIPVAATWDTSSKIITPPPEPVPPLVLVPKKKRRNLIIAGAATAAVALGLVGSMLLGSSNKPVDSPAVPATMQTEPTKPRIEALQIESPQVDGDTTRAPGKKASAHPAKRAIMPGVSQAKKHAPGASRKQRSSGPPPARPNPF